MEKKPNPLERSIAGSIGSALFRPFRRIFHALWTPWPPSDSRLPVTTAIPSPEYMTVGTTLTEMNKPYVSGMPLPPYSPLMPAGIFCAPFPIGPLFHDCSSLAPEEPRPLDTTRMIPMRARRNERDEKHAADFAPPGDLASPIKTAKSTRVPSVAPHAIETGEQEPEAPARAAEEYVSPSAPLSETPPGSRKRGRRARRRGGKAIPPNIPRQKAPERKQ